MPTDAKIAALIDKLLRVAARDSGATEDERRTAAVMAAELMADHKIHFSDEPAKSTSKRTKMTWGTWAPSQALQHSSCSWCHDRISRGDVVWLRVHSPGELEMRHNYSPCCDHLG